MMRRRCCGRSRRPADNGCRGSRGPECPRTHHRGKTMNNSFLIGAAAAVALTAGLAAAPAAAQAGLCTQPNQHCITVTVDKGAGGELKIGVDVAELRVVGPNHVIFWSVKNAPGQHYRFPAN